MTKVYISLGSNQGDREAYLQGAIRALQDLERTKVQSLSSIYETAAWGKEDQDQFLNMVIGLDTELSAQDLLLSCQAIEEALGRVRHEKWGPRTIDIDILLYGNQQFCTDTLKVPHPYMTQRAFVLVPLLEIAPDIRIVGESKTAKEYLAELDQTTVKKFRD
ncbi:2-amino-4-hydroxy-6-hydroxymethyldihydropteridine diphosphokinase [Streptococcus catagoni]|uniref:2-amino-4-hydroxy-6- hydroxymethyldihydropteridine diphosphokinase n=1 Tax=Streptococcus catagoni TaxID=2654874 RepID=UPI00140B9059|nr:2-amino-4-hydroxy-6-hydroxymethyldihydropteridine diphosphokinase [Streptococcus catagoni]